MAPGAAVGGIAPGPLDAWRGLPERPVAPAGGGVDDPVPGKVAGGSGYSAPVGEHQHVAPQLSRATPERRGTRAWRDLRRRVSDARDSWEFRTDNSYRRLAESTEFPDGTRRVYCYHVRKTAGTSLHLSFMALGGEDPFEVLRRITASRLHRTISGPYGYVAYDPRLLAEGAYFYGRSHRAAAELTLPPDTHTVTVLRDPVRRAHSYFDYLVAGDPEGMPGPVGVRERRPAMEGFDAFLDRVAPEYLLTQLSMFSARRDVSEAADRISACSTVFFTEDFPAGLAALGDRLQLPLAVHRARVTGQRSSLTEAQAERLAQVLEPEYELLGRLAARGIAPGRLDNGAGGDVPPAAR